jgi:predicted kinase
MKKLLMLKGLPASGKSTFARQLVSQGWVRVSKDDLHFMLHQGKRTNEKQALTIRDAIIVSSLKRGRNVVVDDTNFDPINEATLRDMATQYQAAFEVDDHFLEVSIEQCIERDLQRCNSVGEKVIRQMYDQYLKRAPAIYSPDPKLKQIVLCDMDGTLAHMNGRSPYEWSRVGEDMLDSAIAQLVEWIQEDVILFSGRDEVCRPETEKWLDDNQIQYKDLYMRPHGDNRKDNIVKRELFDRHIRDKYRVLFVLDDRDQVVKMWREMGLKVLQVGGGGGF